DDAILDLNHDDYYAHSGSWWDVQDSSWLVHFPTRTLTVTAAGPGTVSSTPPMLTSRGTTSSVTLESDSQVRLDASADRGAEFYGWSGACSGDGSCQLTMTSDFSATAVFGTPRPTLRVTITGKGRVASTPLGIDCPGRCSAKFKTGTTVSLRSRPARGWKL